MKDARIEDLIRTGMPDDNERVLIQWAGEYFDERFRGYSLELFGVEPDSDLLERHPREFLNRIGATTPHLVVYRKGSPGNSVSGAFCVWLCRVHNPKGVLVVEEVWNPKAGWVPMTSRISVDDAQMAKLLMKVVENEGAVAKWDRFKSPIIISSNDPRITLRYGMFWGKDEKPEPPAVEVKTIQPPKVRKPRKPRIPEEQFLIEGLAAAEALARTGKTQLSRKDLARQMDRDRETISNYTEFYRGAWVKIVGKFTETKEWLRLYPKR